jgi:pimeloyl-ACP methyl ester carboxylesterase
MEAIRVPTLILCGDEDEACLQPSLFTKHHIPGSGLAVFPKSDHAINLEEPDHFNRVCLDFLTARAPEGQTTPGATANGLLPPTVPHR